MLKHCEKHSRNYYNQCHTCYIEEEAAKLVHESNDRSERKSCGDPAEMMIDERYVIK